MLNALVLREHFVVGELNPIPLRGLPLRRGRVQIEGLVERFGAPALKCRAKHIRLGSPTLKCRVMHSPAVHRRVKKPHPPLRGFNPMHSPAIYCRERRINLLSELFPCEGEVPRRGDGVKKPPMFSNKTPLRCLEASMFSNKMPLRRLEASMFSNKMPLRRLEASMFSNKTPLRPLKASMFSNIKKFRIKIRVHRRRSVLAERLAEIKEGNGKAEKDMSHKQK